MCGAQSFYFLKNYRDLNISLSAPAGGGGGAQTLQLVDKDNGDVCCRSSYQLRISVRAMLKDAAMLSWPDLVKQVLSRRYSCWLANANGAVTSSSPGEGRTVLQTTDYCPAQVLQQQLQQQRSSLGQRGQPSAAATATEVVKGPYMNSKL